MTTDSKRFQSRTFSLTRDKRLLVSSGNQSGGVGGRGRGGGGGGGGEGIVTKHMLVFLTKWSLNLYKRRATKHLL